MTIDGIGIDIVEIKRFLPFKKDKGNRFLTNTFTQKELDYCFSFCDSETHLAGTFSAKEATWKALGKTGILQSKIEIRRNNFGKPEVWINNRRQTSILVSITHEKSVAVAIAVKQ